VLLNLFRITRKVSQIFARFNWFGFLTVTIVGDNIQYMSFRCFSQLYQPLPSGSTQIATIVTSYLSLFFVVIYATCAYFLLPTLFTKHSNMLLEGYRYRMKTIVYLTLICTLKVCAGFIHSALCNDSSTQIISLLSLQSLFLVLLIDGQSLYLCKSIFICHLL
jgi:hypothetical protein